MQKNPLRIKVERPGYKKFKVEDLGINIVGNPKKDYTIVQTNPVFGHDSHRSNALRHGAKRVLVFNQIVSDSAYLSFSDGKVELCIPIQYQISAAILSRLVQKSGARSDTVLNDISNKNGSILEVDSDNWNHILKAAEKFGKVFHKEREITTKKTHVSDSLSDSDGVHIRYLLACCI